MKTSKNAFTLERGASRCRTKKLKVETIFLVREIILRWTVNRGIWAENLGKQLEMWRLRAVEASFEQSLWYI